MSSGGRNVRAELGKGTDAAMLLGIPGITRGPVLAALGFPSAEAFQSYVDTLSEGELKRYLVPVLQVARSLEAPTP